ncbi:cytochrome-c peroxidase [bacterium]|nr:cytochrome-c peroxidase [bacterium]
MKYLITILSLGLMLVITGCPGEPEPPPGPPDYNPTPYEIDLPFRFPVMEIPADNPMTDEGIVLGRRLFYDPILSGDSTQSCASCHQQKFAFTDPDRFSTGIDGLQGDRNAMAIINIGWMEDLFWEGRAKGVEAQALEPIENPIEMHETWENAVLKLINHPTYPGLFTKAFGTDEITADLTVKAIAQFERTLISGNSSYDKFLQNIEGLSQSEFNGRAIFFTERGDCFHCHGGILFTDQLFHNNGLAANPIDIGLEAITSDPLDRGKFKTPTLRNIALTAPFMHDGRFVTLEEVVDFYSEGLQFSNSIDPLMKNVNQGGLRLTPQEKQDLLAFLHTLTDSTFVNNPEFASPF